MDAAGVGEGVAAHDGFVGLHGHVHQRADEAAHAIDFARVDVGVDAQFMTLEYHGYFFFAGIAGAFADTVDGDFHLAGAVEHSAQGVGRSHAQVVVAMGGDDGAVDAVDVVHEIFDFGSVFMREAISGGVGDVDHGGAGLDDGFYYAGQVFVVGAPGVLGIELYVFHVFLGILGGGDGLLQDVFAVGVELILDVVIARADAGVYSFALGILQGLEGTVDVFHLGSCQGTDGGPGHGF